MNRITRLLAAALLLAATATAVGLEPGTIVCERPYVGGQNHWFDDSEQLLTVYVPFQADRVCRFGLVITTNTASNYWDPIQINQYGVGPLRNCKIMPVGPTKDDTISYPDGNWSSTPNLGYGSYFAINNSSPARRVVWTADQDYERVLVRSSYSSGYTDINVALSGSGTLALSQLDLNSTSSPWNGHSVAVPRYITVATNVAKDDAITFTPVLAGTYGVLGHIIGVKAGDADPASADALMLDHFILAAGDAGIDSRAVPLILASTSFGQHIAVSRKDTGHPSGAYWGSEAHSAAANDCATSLSHTVMYFDADHETGAAWAPDAGDRLTTKRLQITTTGTASMWGTAAGTYTQIINIDATGASFIWQIVFAQAAADAGIAINGGGYRNMFNFTCDAGWINAPGAMAGPETLVPVTSDTDGTYWYADSVSIGGGALRDIIVRVSSARPPWGTTQINGPSFLKRSATWRKFYARYSPLTASPMSVAAGTIIGGGGSISFEPAPAKQNWWGPGIGGWGK